MYNYKIHAGKELGELLKKAAEGQNMQVEDFILQILNRYFVPMHTIDQEAMAKGYEEMGELNIELSK